jgi:homoserine kinase type II
MGNFSHLTFKETQEILNLYGEFKLLESIPQALGTSNSNYRVKTSGGDFLLKVANDKTAGELTEEVELLHQIHSFGFENVILPVKPKSSDFVYHYKEYYGVLYPFMDASASSKTPDHCFQIGNLLGKLHGINISQSNFRKYDEIGQPLINILDYLNSDQVKSDYRETFKNVLPPNKVEELLKADLPQALIHGDLYYDNTLFIQDKLKYFIDFEQAGIGCCLLDLCISISSCCLVDGKLKPDLVKEYITGYQSTRELTSQEKKYFSDYLLIACLSISLWRIKRFHNKKLDQKKLDYYKELLNLATQLHLDTDLTKDLF